MDLAGADGEEVGAEAGAGAGKKAETKAVDQIMHSQYVNKSLVHASHERLKASFPIGVASLFLVVLSN